MPQPTTNAQELEGRRLQAADAEGGKLREAFDSFVGETFYGQMLKEMRKTVGKSAYFDGGRAEEIFRGSSTRYWPKHGQIERPDVLRPHVRVVLFESEIVGCEPGDSQDSSASSRSAVVWPPGDAAERASKRVRSHPADVTASRKHEFMAIVWESELATLLNDLTSVQEELLTFLADKRQSLVAMDRVRLDQLQGVERQLISRLQSCQRRRQNCSPTRPAKVGHLPACGR